MRSARALIVILAASALVITSCSDASEEEPGSVSSNEGPSSDGAASNSSGWSREYAGTHLNVLGESVGINRTIIDNLPDFENKTGITVSIELSPYDPLVQKATLDFTTHGGTYDIIDAPSEYLGSFAGNGYILPVNDLHDSDLAGAGESFDREDIIPALWETASKWGEDWYGTPSNSAVMMMFYRKDLFDNADEQKAFKDKYGYPLAPAKTFQEYMDIAQFFTRDAGDTLAGQTLDKPFYGVAMSGKHHEATTLEWLCYLWAFQGAIFDDNGQPAVDGPGSIAATEYMKSLSEFAQPGYTSATWDEINSTLQQGNAAQALQWSDLAGDLEDESKSDVSGKMGYGDIPIAAEGNTSIANAGPWTWVINKDSPNAEAAKLFMAWTATPEMQVTISKDGGVPSTRTAYEDPTLLDTIPYWHQIYKSLTVSKERPRIAEWGAISDLIAENLSSILTDQADLKSSMTSTQSKLKKLMAGKLPVTER